MAEFDLIEKLRKLLRKYDAVEVKLIHGRFQLIGIRRNLEETLTTE